MTDTPRTDETHADADARKEVSALERWELLDHVQAILEPVMIGLGFAFLVLLLLDYSGSVSDPRQGFWLSRSLTIIWGIFVVEFVFRFLIAPSKQRFMKSNWLSAASLALPFLRPFRALRALRAVRSLSLLRLLGGVNRGMRVLRRVIGGNQIAYLASLTIVVVLFSTAGVWYFEQDTAEASIDSFGESLWWSSAMVTTINNELYAVSPEARIIAILLRIYAVSVFGFITATIARYLIGRAMVETPDEADPSGDVGTRLQAMEREIALLREALANTSVSPAGQHEAQTNRADRSGDAG